MFLACVLARKKLVVRHHHRQPKMTPAESDREFWSRVHSGFNVCLAFRKAKRSTKNLQRCLFSPGPCASKAISRDFRAIVSVPVRKLFKGVLRDIFADALMYANFQNAVKFPEISGFR